MGQKISARIFFLCLPKGMASHGTQLPVRDLNQSLRHFSLRYYFGPNHGIYHAASVFTLRGPLFTKFRVR